MSQERSQPSPVRRYVVLALKISVSLILLFILFSKIDLGDLWQTARGASVPWLLVALAIYALSSVVAVWRWNLLLKAQHIPITFRSLFGSYMVAAYFNNFLPSNIGGDANLAVAQSCAASILQKRTTRRMILTESLAASTT